MLTLNLIPGFFYPITPALILTTGVEIIANIFFGMAVYQDAKSRHIENAAVWGVMCGFFAWIPAVVYLYRIRDEKRTRCTVCGKWERDGYVICPQCGNNKILRRGMNDPAEIGCKKLRKSFIIVSLVLRGALVFLSLISSVIMFFSMITDSSSKFIYIPISSLAITVLTSIARILLGVAVYNDVKARRLEGRMLWGVTCGMFGLIPGIVYLFIRRKRARKECQNCHTRIHSLYACCPVCGAPFGIDPEPGVAELKDKSMRFFWGYLAAMGLYILLFSFRTFAPVLNFF